MRNGAALVVGLDCPRLFARAADSLACGAVSRRFHVHDVTVFDVAGPPISAGGIAWQDKRYRVASLQADDATVVGFGEWNFCQTVTP